jgi:hypothetical protein
MKRNTWSFLSGKPERKILPRRIILIKYYRIKVGKCGLDLSDSG